MAITQTVGLGPLAFANNVTQGTSWCKDSEIKYGLKCWYQVWYTWFAISAFIVMIIVMCGLNFKYGVRGQRLYAHRRHRRARGNRRFIPTPAASPPTYDVPSQLPPEYETESLYNSRIKKANRSKIYLIPILHAHCASAPSPASSLYSLPPAYFPPDQQANAPTEPHTSPLRSHTFVSSELQTCTSSSSQTREPQSPGHQTCAHPYPPPQEEARVAMTVLLQ